MTLRILLQQRRAILIWSLVLLVMGTIDVVVTTPADTLAIQVVHHTVTSQTPDRITLKDITIFSTTLHDEAAIARTRALIAELPIRVGWGYRCPQALADHYSYEIRFYHLGVLVEVSAGDATGCEDWHVNAVVARCCASSDFYTRLHDATGAPVPPSF